MTPLINHPFSRFVSPLWGESESEGVNPFSEPLFIQSLVASRSNLSAGLRLPSLKTYNLKP
jgi:hypothetical protein